MIEPAPLQQVDRTYVMFRGRRLSYFAGCDYFRLASHPAVLRALRQGLARHGLNVAASRLTTGNHALYEKLEQRLARFFKTGAALLVPTGYLTSLTVAQAMKGRVTHALIDEKAHVSLQDAAKFLDCPTLPFKHLDPVAVAKVARRCGRRAKILLLTDGLFSGPGEVAPLADYLRILPRSALLLVDDAHGAGVLGEHGRGSPEHTHIQRGRIIQTVTLSKAFGVYGGAVLCSSGIRRQILRRSRAFVGSTPLPLPLARAALQAIDLHRTGRNMRLRLRQNVARVKSALRQAGMVVPNGPGPSLSIHPRNPRHGNTLRRALLAAGVFPSFIKYPGGPAGGYFRFAISSEHTLAQLDALARVLCRGCGEGKSGRQPNATNGRR